jgi:hypothetical protein
MADVAALWMLVTLFRARWAVLGPLSLYLFGTLTLPATMWWIASLNQMSMQIGFFLAVGAWVLYLRTSRTRWLLVTVLAIALGLTSDSKSLLILPVLVFVLVSYFAAGSPVQRVRSVLQRYWRAALAVGVPAVLYLGYYVSAVEQPFMGVGVREIGRTASAMLGRAFTTAAVGGPWGWDPVNPPNANADPPATAVQLALVVVVLVILFGALRRHRTLRAWGLLAGYLVALLALLVTSRVPAYGASIGLEYRFLTDAACVLCLCVGLAFLPVVGAHESTTPRADPLLRVRIPVPAQIGLLAVVLCSSLFSSVRYVDIWHQQNDSVTYLSNLRSDLRTYGAVDLVDQPVPEEIISPLGGRSRRSPQAGPDPARCGVDARPGGRLRLVGRRHGRHHSPDRTCLPLDVVDADRLPGQQRLPRDRHGWSRRGQHHGLRRGAQPLRAGRGIVHVRADRRARPRHAAVRR